MSDQTIDPYQRLQIVRNDNGTITRLLKLPDTPASPDPTLPNSPDVLSKDVLLDQSKSTWVRIYLPCHALDNSSTSSSSRLPLVVNFHGGGFITFSASSSLVHDFALNSAAQLSAVLVSVEYRLAPEHRLPAAYEDAMDALHWIRSAEDDWLRSHADLAQCFLMGGSAGANIAYHAGLRAAAEAQSLEPIKFRGLILHQPFFGGAQRSGSELRLVNDLVLPLSVSDLMWELALPVGVDRDHEYCNLTAGDGGFKGLELIGSLEWKVLVTGCDGDPLFDRQIEFVKMLEGKGVRVVAHFGEGEYHGVELVDTSKAKLLNVAIQNFMSS
ncbi:Alpha/beta hydrolase fold [Parasponia andersonii]|uniref:Alpha/beta hydrolase fold n=1 Tax=Parasponia andersonii TaxID=3476 RepID=A0A2P5D9J4_PARAD|nr:Alpha/beta hydrolase fold [Parasponia andersonii]